LRARKQTNAGASFVLTHVVDTCGWIEWLVDGALAENFAPCLSDTGNLIVPTLVQFELYKWTMRERDEATALGVIGLTEACQVQVLDTRIALLAAELATQHALAMADAIIYATARAAGGILYTSDAHFSGLPGVCYWPKQA
jgi:predicted nucleic acid-binding protein